MLESYAKQFESVLDPQTPAWLKTQKESSLHRFLKLGFPTTDLEEWKYTSLKLIAETDFLIPSTSKLDKEQIDKLFQSNRIDRSQNTLVFIDGIYSPKFSTIETLPSGARVESLSSALNSDPLLIQSYLGTHSAKRDHPLLQLNTAFFKDGAFVYLPKKTKIEKPVQLIFISTLADKSLLNSPRNLIIAESGSHASIVEHFLGFEGTPSWTNTVTEIFAQDQSSLEHYKIQNQASDSFHTANLISHQDRNSNLVFHSVSLGGRLTRNDQTALLDAEGSECTLNGLYLSNENQHVDNHTQIDHLKPHCTSHELYKGILDGKSQGVFNGHIIVRPKAFKTHAVQSNKNLLLSNDASINTKPLLEIYNNDVKCNHGATIGRLDENQVFYLRARGLQKEFARHLLTYAFAGDLIEKMKQESIRNTLKDFLFLKLMDKPGEAA